MEGTTPHAAGLYGMHSTTWASVRKALRVLGGQYDRTTSSHGSVLIAMPTGRKIAVGKESNGRQSIMGDGLRQLFAEARQAEVPMALLLAQLDAAGCSWRTSIPFMVDEMRKMLAEIATPVHTQDGWRRAMKALKERLDEQGATVKAEEEDPPSPPRATVDVEAARAAWQQARVTHPFLGPEVVELASVPDEHRARAVSLTTTWANKRTRWVRPLLDEGKIIRALDPDFADGKERWLFAEDAALQVSEKLIQLYGTKEVAVTEEHATPEAPEQPQEAPAPDVGTEGTVKLGKATLRPSGATEGGVADARPAPVASDPDPALLQLCRHYGVEPVVRVDYAATLAALAEAARR